MGLLELILVIAVVGGIVAVLLPTFRGAAADARSDEARRARGPVATGEGGGGGGGAKAVRALEERRRAVIESLSEIEADRDAGNLSQPDYERQRRRYEREAAAVLLELEAAQRSTEVAVTDREAQVAAQRGRGRVPAALGWALAGIGFGSLALVILSGSLGTRGEGEVMTGTVPGSGAQEQTRQRGALVPIDTARLAALERMVAEDSSNVESLVELSDLYLATQQFDEVARLSMKALAMDSTNPGALTNVGMVLAASGHREDGIEAFDHALETDPDFARALLFKGIITFQSKDFRTAIDAWEHYLRVAPPEANITRVEAMLEGARMAAAGQPEP